ncbi:X-ray repair cross-complementing protein 6-like, partial [Lingula anatina]|uniref:DNA helicase n=1 Tax=Lingula anatina TaxID=7574 RepID=A0A2R2MMT7_LINAN
MDFTWGTQFGDDDDEDNEEEGFLGQAGFGGRDGLIFLIDCAESMFQNGDSEETPFELCIKCTKNVIQNKIISSDRDLLGVVFYGTEKDKNLGDFKNVYVLQPLEQPGAPAVLQLEALLEEGNDDFDTNYGHSSTYSLGDALWTCQNMFSHSPHKINYKRVMLFTNDDDPHRNNNSLKNQAKAKAVDLHETGIELELMHIQKPAEGFDLGKFYRDILYFDDDENTVLADPAEKFEELLTRVRSKDHKKRATARIPLSLGKDLNMSVGVYNLVRACPKPYGVKLYKKTNEEVKTVTDLILK